MTHLANHATDAGSILNFNNLGDLMQPQSDEGLLLVHRSANAALDLLDFYLCHFIELSFVDLLN